MIARWLAQARELGVSTLMALLLAGGLVEGGLTSCSGGALLRGGRSLAPTPDSVPAGLAIDSLEPAVTAGSTWASARGGVEPTTAPIGRVVAVETFLADMARQVAGDRLVVEALIPPDVDPHGYEATAADVRTAAESMALIVNGLGLEEALLNDLLEGLRAVLGGKKPVIVASKGLQPQMREGPGGEEEDPHLWLDPLLARRYVANIRQGLSALDPEGAAAYTANERRYAAELERLHREIRAILAPIPEERRLLVTNHESLGYFAERYDLRLVGSVLPSTSSLASPSARDVAALIETIRSTGVPAIFLEAGADPKLAEAIARETGSRVIGDLHTHSLSAADGPAATYLDMMRYNARRIAEGLAGSEP